MLKYVQSGEEKLVLKHELFGDYRFEKDESGWRLYTPTGFFGAYPTEKVGDDPKRFFLVTIKFIWMDTLTKLEMDE